jgi:hypothetical protein
MNPSQLNGFSLLRETANACSTLEKFEKMDLIGAGTYG